MFHTISVGNPKKGGIMSPLLRSILFSSVCFLSITTHAGPFTEVSSSYQNGAENAGTPKQSAIAFLKAASGELGLPADLQGIRFESVSATPEGYVVRFAQFAQGLPLDRSGIAVTLSKSLMPIAYVNSAVPDSILRFQNESSVSRFVISDAAALMRVYESLNLSSSPNSQEVVRKVMMIGGILRPVYQVQLSAPADRRYAWEVVLDAENGAVYRSRDLTLHSPGRGTISVNVLDPNPTIRSGKALNGVSGYVDGNNADSAFYQSMMTPVALDNLKTDGSKYQLSGPNAVVVDSESPKNPDCTLKGDALLKRNDPCFDAVNAYYFLDKEMKYLNGTLGFNFHPLKYSGGVHFDPHGLNGDDNSHYSPYSDELAFGEGGVDDAQDHDVVIHEMGHALHNWATKGHISQVEGLSEGSGDYWAASYDRQFMKPGHIAYNWTFSFDGHNEFWPGRVVNVAKNYPSGAAGEIHVAGQLWATVCMEIYDAIGKQKADKLFWSALSSLDERSNQADAAKAYVMAASQIYPEVQDVVVKKFKARGYPVR